MPRPVTPLATTSVEIEVNFLPAKLLACLRFREAMLVPLVILNPGNNSCLEGCVKNRLTVSLHSSLLRTADPRLSFSSVTLTG